MISDCKIIAHEVISKDYRRIRFHAPEICRSAKPGQFVHVQIPSLSDRILRRPFSICDMEDDILTVVYKIVGVGTARLADAQVGTMCSIMGPLGTFFPEPEEGKIPVLIDGGYGAAATLPIARRWKQKGILLLGARTQDDVLLTEEYKACGYDVRVATQDGSVGTKGLVTELIPGAIADTNGKCVFYSCGPNGMLMAVGVGFLVSFATQLLSKSGRDEQVMLVIISGIVTVLLLLVGEIGALFAAVRAVFGL